MVKRIFLAINLPEGTKKKLLGYQEKWPELPARWTRPENLHITLMFLGNTSEEELHEAKKSAREVVANYQPFSFLLSKIVYGPTPKQPRMIWAVGEAPQELVGLRHELARALNHQEEHLFTPHLTLARFHEWQFRRIEPEERPHINEEIDIEIAVKSIEIMESKLRRTSAEYSVIESIPLSP